MQSTSTASGSSVLVTCNRCGRLVRSKPGTTAPASHTRPAGQQRNAWSKVARFLCREA